MSCRSLWVSVLRLVRFRFGRGLLAWGGGGSGFALSDSACSLGLGGVFQGGLTFGLGVFQRVFEAGSQEL